MSLCSSACASQHTRWGRSCLYTCGWLSTALICQRTCTWRRPITRTPRVHAHIIHGQTTNPRLLPELQQPRTASRHVTHHKITPRDITPLSNQITPRHTNGFTGEDPHSCGLVLEWIFGSIVSTAEKARDGAKRPLGSYLPHVADAHAVLLRTLEDAFAWESRLGQVCCGVRLVV